MGCKTETHLTVAATTLLLCSAALGQETVSAAPSPAVTPVVAKRLDLRVPKVTEIYTEQQIATFLARARAEDLDEVEVEGSREPREPVTPNVWGGIAAPLWAVLHPTQAWRIFAPLPPDQLRRAYNPQPDATAPYQVTAARSARDL
jgi:hypothetical protein